MQLAGSEPSKLGSPAEKAAASASVPAASARPSSGADDRDRDAAPARPLDRVLHASTAVAAGDHPSVREVGEPVEHLDLASYSAERPWLSQPAG